METDDARRQLRSIMGGSYVEATDEWARELSQRDTCPVTDDDGREWCLIAATDTSEPVWARNADDDETGSLLVVSSWQHDYRAISDLAERAGWEMVDDSHCHNIVVRIT